ncbi:MAG: restriction endonuclease subunit S [Mesorhizobium sp.]|uniref:restriction endonuclease subunit S n=1 Tax=Mesorhizobium sp. TaxID=1871066 RepID=UPI000FE69F17|nr:restriction endonuclease subunit S [Mesorhizobium sp.]RWH48027.1 MAG: restriction endonuclease subunit S [Mesorhizobium sp.]
MIDGLRPYPEMKASGVEWLPILPEGWEIHRAKDSFREADDRSAAGDEELLSVSHKTGVTPRSHKNITMFMAESYEGHKVCRTGDIVVNTMWAWMAAIGVSRQIGIVSPAYGIYRPRTADRFEPKFLDYLLRTEIYRAEYVRSSRGITTSRLRLYPPDFLNIPFVQPPLDEQRLIVRFLDWHGVQTAKLIRAKQSLLKLVAEEREALTHDVVSSPGTQQMRLVNLVDHIFRRVERESTRTYTPVGLFNRGRGIFQKPPTRGDDLGDSTFSWIEDGDLILSGQFAWEGAVALAGADEAGCIASHRYHILRGKEELIQTIYLSSFLRTSFGHLLLNEHSRGAAGRNRPLNIRTLLKEKIPVPPQSEQARLIELVTLEKRLAGSIATFADRLREFRMRLIADVVTGKLDVRAASAGLPEASELASSDDLAEGDDLDEGTDDAEVEEVAA